MKLAKFSAKLVANFRRSLEGDFRASFAGENRQEHFPPKLHRKFHHPASLRGSGLWQALKKGLARSVSKVSKKFPNTDFVVFLTLFRVKKGLFRHFFDAPGQEAWEDLFETFWGIRAQRASGLLYMAAPIAMPGPYM